MIYDEAIDEMMKMKFDVHFAHVFWEYQNFLIHFGMTALLYAEQVSRFFG
jgi:hypothetical protein